MAYSTATIGKGCFGKVYKVNYNGTWAAVKKVPQEAIDSKSLKREVDVYKKSNHPNIVKLVADVTLKDGKWIIPLEFIFGEELETTIFQSSKSKIKLTPEAKGTIIIGMCEGLYYLHSKDIVHQDLKPDNIMVEHETNRAVIIDLGLAKFFKYGLNSAIDMGNTAYAAPEVLKCGIQRDHRSDVWAMGKIIAELLARVRLYTPSVCPSKIKETLKDQPLCPAVCRMVETDPTLRSSMGGVINDIRLNVRKGIADNQPAKKDHLKPPSSNIDRGNRSPSPEIRGRSPAKSAPSPFSRDLSPITIAPSPMHKPSPPLQFERSPRPQMKTSPARFRQHHSPSPKKAVDKIIIPGGLPKGGLDLTGDFMKMQLYKEAAKELPCSLPTTGRVVVRQFQEKNGAVEGWLKEVDIEDGKIVKYNDVKFNCQ